MGKGRSGRALPTDRRKSTCWCTKTGTDWRAIMSGTRWSGVERPGGEKRQRRARALQAASPATLAAPSLCSRPRARKNCRLGLHIGWQVLMKTAQNIWTEQPSHLRGASSTSDGCRPRTCRASRPSIGSGRTISTPERKTGFSEGPRRAAFTSRICWPSKKKSCGEVQRTGRREACGASTRCARRLGTPQGHACGDATAGNDAVALAASGTGRTGTLFVFLVKYAV